MRPLTQLRSGTTLRKEWCRTCPNLVVPIPSTATTSRKTLASSASTARTTTSDGTIRRKAGKNTIGWSLSGSVAAKQARRASRIREAQRHAISINEMLLAGRTAGVATAGCFSSIPEPAAVTTVGSVELDLKARMDTAGVTQTELAEHLGKKRCYVSALLNGIRPWPRGDLRSGAERLSRIGSGKWAVVEARK